MPARGLAIATPRVEARIRRPLAAIWGAAALEQVFALGVCWHRVLWRIER
jgi:hypothetical protein